MQWRVDGASEESGEEMTLTLDAPSREVAELLARQRGLLVASIAAINQLSPVEALAAARDSRATLSYSSPLDNTRIAPKYWGLRIAAGALWVMAVLYYLAGLYLLCSSAFGALRNSRSYYNVEQFIWGVFGLNITLLAIGAFCHGLSAACIALRDIAINSFSRRP